MSQNTNSASGAMECPFKPGNSSNSSTASKQHQTVNENDLVPIPQPPVHWFTRNMPEITPTFPTSSNWRLAAMYGEIVKLDLVSSVVVIVSSYDLINEVYDENRFEKHVEGGLEVLREVIGDGLFSAYSHEKNWYKAHRILMPVFGPLSIRKMFPQMQDMISQMVLRWDRLGADNEIVLAFDTIAICGFSYRFNSFYRDNTHPFAQQMADTLIDAGKRANRTTIENTLRVFSAAETRKNVQNMWKLCDDLVAERKRNPQPDVHDVLNAMLNSADPETGEKLSDENIRFNMLTFLIAGHETTSGTLSFLFYNFLQYPETMHKAQAEVDRVVGDNVLEPGHLPQLKYLKACIQETLRVLGPITQNNVHAKEDTVIGGKYKITKDMTVRINLRGLHHDTQVWGADADVFRPERMLDSGFERMPQNAWKPFGNGSRSCIGRFLAEQEMLMALAMIFQRFQVDMADPSYDLHLKSTLTVKPADFKIKVSRRPGKSSNVGIPGSVPASAREGVREKQAKSGLKTDPAASKNPLLILYGSNAGTCKYIAEDLQTMAKERGLNPEVKTMDEATEHLPTNLPVIIISPSYEGKPADNARKFVAWVESLESGALENVTFGVFGVGNSEWANTFHKVPRFLNDTLLKLGAKLLTKAGFVDVKEDVVGPWEDWRDELLNSVGDEKHPTQAPELSVKFEKPSMANKLAGSDVSEALVKKNIEIASAEFGSAKRHMEVELPEGNTYEPGDYLVVMPTNPPDLIKRVVRRFNLNLDDTLTISGTSKEFLTGSGPVSVIDLIAARLELNTPASKRQLQTIARLADDAEQKSIMNMASSDSTFNAEVISKRRSILDILEDFPSAKLSFAQFIDMLKPLAPRQYSISSSPLASELSNRTFSIVSQPSSDPGPVIASITYDVHKAPARSGQNRMFHGTASTYLASHDPGSKIRCYVRRSNSGFHLPADPETPIIMICAGTGLAPFRGFVQERACVLEASHDEKKLAPALLYFGCRDAEKDFLYRDEFSGWEKAGAVSMRPTFSRVGNKGEGTWKYVHDRMWDDREELRTLFAGGAKIYVCGSASKLAKSAADVVIRIWQENNPGKSDVEAREWLDGIREVRYVSDVFD
ncbi:putative Cytochrome P450 [Seiridium cardinale]